MTAEIERLADQLRRSLEGGAWHGPSVLELLADVSAPRAALRPIAGVHTIWEIVLHLTSDYDLVLRRLAGDGRSTSPEEDWPPCPEPTEENWRQAVRRLESRGGELRRAVQSFPPERLGDPLVPEIAYPAYTQFIGVTQHHSYHAGQIALLKRISEPPTSRSRTSASSGC
ncbi:MAG: DinB family protein [bacterium]